MRHIMQKQQGFTLLELMIALAIVGILAAVAIPSYRQSVLKTNRIDAQITMARLATLEERFYFMNNNYTADFAEIVDCGASCNPITSDEGQYTIVLTGGGAAWTMEATAVNNQAKDTNCAKMKVTSLGVKTSVNSSNVATTDCWK